MCQSQRRVHLGKCLPKGENEEEVEWSANTFTQCAELGRMQRSQVIPSGELSQLNMVIQVPYGVVGCNTPWKYPAAAASLAKNDFSDTLKDWWLPYHG